MYTRCPFLVAFKYCGYLFDMVSHVMYVVLIWGFQGSQLFAHVLDIFRVILPCKKWLTTPITGHLWRVHSFGVMSFSAFRSLLSGFSRLLLKIFTSSTAKSQFVYLSCSRGCLVFLRRGFAVEKNCICDPARLGFEPLFNTIFLRARIPSQCIYISSYKRVLSHTSIVVVSKWYQTWFVVAAGVEASL